MHKKLNIIVTAGGVTERIDSVRKITNSSSGKLGITIANKLSRQYPNATVTIIGSRQAFENNTLEPYGTMKTIKIESTADLEKEVTLALRKEHVDIFVHTMAVADYTTEAVIDIDKFTELIKGGRTDVETVMQECEVDTSSKIPSSLNMMIKMKKTPKIIHMIKEISPRTFLVGFKLLNEVPEGELFDVGFDLLRKNRCNLVVANDLANIRKGNHRALIIYPEKSYDVVEGKNEIAEELVKLIDKRAFVKHPKSLQIGENNNVGENEDLTEVFESMAAVGRHLYDNGYLPEVTNHDRPDKTGTYGNISVKVPLYNIMLITSRNVHKGRLQTNDVSYVTDVNSNGKDDSVYAKVHYYGVLKPSIDAAIHASIYELTRGKAIIHIHTNKVFLGYPYIDEQFPCGSMEERDAIIKALKRGHKDVAELEHTHVVQMKKHGLIVVGKDLKTCEDKIYELFHETPYINTDVTCVDEEVIQHIKDVKAEFVGLKGSQLYNLELDSKTIGCVWEKHEDKSIGFGIFTKSDSPKGLHVVEKYLSLYNKTYFLYTTPGCNIDMFYREKYGFEKCYRDSDNLIILCRE